MGHKSGFDTESSSFKEETKAEQTIDEYLWSTYISVAIFYSKPNLPLYFITLAGNILLGSVR